MSTTSDLAERFVKALMTIDVDTLRTCLAPDARFWVNIGPTEFTIDQRLGALELEGQHLAEHGVEDVRITSTEYGFVVQLVTVGTTTGGEALRVAVCLVATVNDGLITRVDEYADSEAAKPLLRALYG
ncbi:MAG: nuclear transport factor 2 family protein [Acidimicrobiia bacterium]|nr:nuclear transport factor 2 family protein [Acidimicrobiia bacterium]